MVISVSIVQTSIPVSFSTHLGVIEESTNLAVSNEKAKFDSFKEIFFEYR